MIEKTPIDIYRESRIKSIYIDISRIRRYKNRYSLKVTGLEREFNINKVPRETALKIVDSIHSQYSREYNIIYSNLHTRTIIRDMMLYHISEKNYERDTETMDYKRITEKRNVNIFREKNNG